MKKLPLSIILLIVLLMPTQMVKPQGEGPQTLEANFYDAKVTVTSPAGWQGDSHYKFNRMAIYRSKEDLEGKEGLIFVGLTSKINLNINIELTKDFQDVLATNPSATRGTFKADHSIFTVHSIGIYNGEKLKKADVYLDPGKSSNYFLHFTIEYTNRAPTDEELNAFRGVIRSALMQESK